jgi:hypothetical protein
MKMLHREIVIAFTVKLGMRSAHGRGDFFADPPIVYPAIDDTKHFLTTQILAVASVRQRT